MTDWWSADPVANAPAKGGDWWKADPVAAPMSGADTAADVAKSLPLGLAKGTIGMPGDLMNLGGAGVDWAAKKLMSPEQFAVYQANQGPRAPLPTSQDVGNAIGYQPKSNLGQLAETAGAFLPAAIGGPETLAARLATRVAIPAAAAEGASHATQGTSAETWAPTLAALLTGHAAGGVARSMERLPGPTTGEIKQVAGNQYDALTSRHVATPIPQGELDNLAADIRTTLNNKEGIRPSNAPGIHSAIDEIQSPATAGAPDVADLVVARKAVKNLLGSQDASKAGAVVALPKIEAAIERLSPGTMADLREADQNWSAVKANEALDKRMARAELRASGEHSGMNTGNRIRQNVTNYLLSNESKYLSPANRAALEKVVSGTVTQNALRMGSNLLGGGGGLGSTMLGVAGVAGGAYTNHPEAALLPVAGMGLRMLGNRATARQAATAAAGIRNRSPYGQQVAASTPAPPRLSATQLALLTALLSAQKGAGALPVPQAQAPIMGFRQ